MSNLDEFVKGPLPGSLPKTVQSTSGVATTLDTQNASTLSDPLASLPSSPPQIYLNLLILEASLRAQWLQLRTRRRQHTFFMALLSVWVLYFGYALFLAPREDGSGVGGSVYWAVELAEKLSLLGGLVTGMLVWGTGQWERGVRWPRRWVYNTNRGLRGFNCKIVVVKQSWWKELFSMISSFSNDLFSSTSRSSYRYVDHTLMRESEKMLRSCGHYGLSNIHEEDITTGYEQDLAPGGDHVKLLLLPKPFSPSFRENWDVYRTEYWEKENERRAILLTKLQEHDRVVAKQQGGWLWWTGYHGWKQRKSHDIEKSYHAVHKHGASEKEKPRVRSGSFMSPSHSRNSSRSTTPIPEPEEGSLGGRHRRGSTASNVSEKLRKKALTGNRGKSTTTTSHSLAAEVTIPSTHQNSLTSISAMHSVRP